MALEDSVIVSAVDFIETYKREFGIYYIFNILRDSHKFFSPDEILRLEKGGFPQPTDDMIRKYRLGKGVPRSVRGLDALAEIGINFPITVAQERFMELNRLVSWLWLSGRLDHNYCPSIALDGKNSGTYRTNDEVLNALRHDMPDFEFRKIEGRGSYAAISRSGNPLGRVANLMGVPVGAKIHARSIPSYLVEFAKNFSSESGNVGDVAYSCCFDFVSLMLSLEGGDHGGFRVRLSARSDPKSAEHIAHDVGDLIEAVSGVKPLVKYEPRNSISANGNRRDIFMPVLYINRSNYRRLAEQGFV